ncbi:MAG: hypothetical protein WBF64_00185, partial [Xanthobacteraceae bacterium]
MKIEGLPIRQPLRVRGGEIDNPPDHRAWLIVAPQKTDAAQLDQAGKRLRRPHQQSSIDAFQMNPIVAHETRETQAAVSCGVE